MDGQRPRGAGVYAIRNTIDDKVYIGSAVNLRKRQNEHFAHLRRGVHHSPYLQRAYNKHGRDAFRFEVLMTAPVSWILNIEQALLDRVHPEYNMATEARSRLGAPQPESMKKAQSERMKRRWAEADPAERASLTEKTSKKIRTYWKDRPAEVRLEAATRASAAALKKWNSLSDEERKKIGASRGEKTRNWWASLSAEEKEVVCAKRRGPREKR